MTWYRTVVVAALGLCVAWIAADVIRAIDEASRRLLARERAARTPWLVLMGTLRRVK
ncbi:MAG TPA: hypothetical protein VNP04_19630 [Alphaproteobacteria bacterium]|nr:hypothetical protein [Alphaproteobacteria bacterium]